MLLHLDDKVDRERVALYAAENQSGPRRGRRWGTAAGGRFARLGAAGGERYEHPRRDTTGYKVCYPPTFCLMRVSHFRPPSPPFTPSTLRVPDGVRLNLHRDRGHPVQTDSLPRYRHFRSSRRRPRKRRKLERPEARRGL